MISPLPEKIETVLYEILNEVAPLNGHCLSQPLPVQTDLRLQAIPARFVGMPGAFHGGHLSKICDNLQDSSLPLLPQATRQAAPYNPIRSSYTLPYSVLSLLPLTLSQKLKSPSGRNQDCDSRRKESGRLNDYFVWHVSSDNPPAKYLFLLPPLPLRGRIYPLSVQSAPQTPDFSSVIPSPFSEFRLRPYSPGIANFFWLVSFLFVRKTFTDKIKWLALTSNNTEKVQRTRQDGTAPGAKREKTCIAVCARPTKHGVRDAQELFENRT